MALSAPLFFELGSARDILIPRAERGLALNELTPRAVITGALLGVLLAVANTYMGFKVGMSESGNLIAALLAFAVLGRGSRGLSPLENNISQTVAVMSGAMASMLMGPLASLVMMGHVTSSWVMIAWMILVGSLGLTFALPLREKLIVREQLPFPTGVATAALIETLSQAKEAATSRLKALGLGAGASAVIALLRDGKWALIPGLIPIPGTLQGIPLAGLSLGFAPSPLLWGVGALVGVRVGVWILVGGLVGNLVLGATALSNHWVAEPSNLLSWLVWPGTGLVLGGSAVSLFRQRKAFFSLSLNSKQAVTSGGEQERWLRRYGRVAMGLAVTVGLAVAADSFFSLPWFVTVMAVAMAFVLAGVAARSAGQTDVAPNGPLAQVAQVSLAAVGVNEASLGLASSHITAGVNSTVTTSLWCFKTGELLKANIRPQLMAQVLGTVLGAFTCAGVLQLLTLSGQMLGSPSLPAPAAVMFRTLAAALGARNEPLPPHAFQAFVAALCLGVLLSSLPQKKWMPPPLAMGVGFLLPVYFSLSIWFGGMLVWAVALRRPKAAEELSPLWATGAVAAESLVALALTGWSLWRG